LAQFAASKSQPVTATPPAADKPEVELPLTQKDIFAISGVEAWACVRAAFGDKEEYTFSESKFGHTGGGFCRSTGIYSGITFNDR
jgi:hypothetical protein